MPKSKSVRKGKSRSRKAHNKPAKIGRGYEVVKGPKTLPDFSTASGAISASLDDSVVNSIVIYHDDTPQPHEQPKHIRGFRKK